jgi:hypothetical protein
VVGPSAPDRRIGAAHTRTAGHDDLIERTLVTTRSGILSDQDVLALMR